MVRITIVGGTGRVGRPVSEHLAALNKYEVIIWTRGDPSKTDIQNAKIIQVKEYNHDELVEKLRGTEVVLAFFNPMSDPGSKNQIALIDACVAAGVKRVAPSEWAGKIRSGIDMYSMKEPVLDHLEDINKDKKVIEYGIFQPGFLMDYLAHPSPPSKHFDTFPLLFDLGKQRAILVEGGKAPVTWTASADVGKVVAHAIDSSEPWTLNGGMVGEKSDFATLVATAEKVTGKKFQVDNLKAEDIENGEFKASWVPAWSDDIPQETMDNVLLPFVRGWALGFHKGITDMEPVFNKKFPDIKFTTVEEMLKGAWERIQQG